MADENEQDEHLRCADIFHGKALGAAQMLYDTLREERRLTSEEYEMLSELADVAPGALRDAAMRIRRASKCEVSEEE